MPAMDSSLVVSAIWIGCSAFSASTCSVKRAPVQLRPGMSTSGSGIS